MVKESSESEDSLNERSLKELIEKKEKSVSSGEISSFISSEDDQNMHSGSESGEIVFD